MIRFYVFSVLLYGVEALTYISDMQILRAFEILVYHRIVRTSWLDKVTLKQFETDEKGVEVENIMRNRKVIYFCHDRSKISSPPIGNTRKMIIQRKRRPNRLKYNSWKWKWKEVWKKIVGNLHRHCTSVNKTIKARIIVTTAKKYWRIFLVISFWIFFIQRNNFRPPVY